MTGSVLILTASITPPADAAGVVRLDPRLRLADYQDALDYYAGFIDRGLDHILFCENTDSDLTTLRQSVMARSLGDRITLVGFSGNDFPPDYGRCYGESIILDRAMSQPVIQAMPAETIFWKCTGRYKLANLHRMIASRPPVDFYCDIRRRGPVKWADMRLMSWTKAGYREFMEEISGLLRGDLRDLRPGEEALYDVLSERMARTSLPYAATFTAEPLIDGYRAFDNQNWSMGRQRLVYWVREVQRRLLRRVLI